MQSHMILFGLAMQERRRRIAARRDHAAMLERRAAAGFDEPETAEKRCAFEIAGAAHALGALALTLFTR